MKFIECFLVLTLPSVSQLQAQTWQWLGPDSAEVHHVFARGDTLYLGTKGPPAYPVVLGAILRSTNGGASWDTINHNIPPRWVFSLAVDPNDTRVVYLSNSGTLYKSTNAGESWFEIGTQFQNPVRFVAVSSHSRNVVFCIVRQPAAGAGNLDDLYRSTDGGQTWTFVGGDFAYSSHGVEIEIAFDLVDSLKMYATGNTQFDIRFYVSTDGGSRWRSVSFCSAQRILPTRGGRIFVYPSIYWSDDEGLSWTTVDTACYPWDQWRPWHMVLDPENDSILFGAGRYPSNAVRKSKDRGKTWEVVSGSEAMNFSYTSNYSLFNVELLSIDPLSKRLYLGTNGQGVYRYDPLVSVQEESELPSAFHLYQNYPNPFNPITMIKYTLPERVFVVLSVYDILGKEVRTLAKEEQNPGTYTVDFNGGGMPSGVYLYRFTAGTKTVVRKMVLIK